MGAAERRKGNLYELELAHWLSGPLDVDIYTSRDGRGGAQGGADLHSHDGGTPCPHVRGWTIEAKNVRNRAVPTWLGQAAAAAAEVDTEWWCVIHRTAGTSDRNLDTVFLPRRMLLDFVLYGQPTRPYSAVDPYVALTLGEWCEVAS